MQRAEATGITAKEGDMVMIGTAQIACPACDTIVPVPVEGHLDNEEHSHLGEARLVCEPDMTDLWAHMWTHDN